jgi:hypothetical protein
VNEQGIPSFLNCRRGSVVAPAGCGKTETIALAACQAPERRLILTHTIAGVDAIRARIVSKGLSPKTHEVSTIAAWSLRLATSFPIRSSFAVKTPTGGEWDLAYLAVGRLLSKGHIKSIITASYDALLVDEYQDCTKLQHELISALAEILPTCVFGDPLQAIFGFDGSEMPDWDREVLAVFPKVAELSRPYRWEKSGNKAFGQWLLSCRDQLSLNGLIDLRTAPPAFVSHYRIQKTNGYQSDLEKSRIVQRALQGKDRCIVIADSKNEERRARLARSVKCTSIEPVHCKTLHRFVVDLERQDGERRLDLVLRLLAMVMTKADASALKRVAAAAAEGRRRKALSESEAACLEILKTRSLSPVLDLLKSVPRLNNGWIYRRELYSVICAAMTEVIVETQPTLADAVWDVQNRRRHLGRRFGSRSIGSTLLVKGLEFEHAILVDVESMKKNDLYVALTRASRTVTIISESPLLTSKVT